MSAEFRIEYNPQVIAKDFKNIPKPDLQRIIRTIESKLGTSPTQYGKPLRTALSGYWKLKVGHYRVVYQVLDKIVTVVVLHIGQRKDSLVYQESEKRARQNL